MESEKICEVCGWTGTVANAMKKCPKCENKRLIPKGTGLVEKPQKEGQIVEIKNLIVSQAPRSRIAIGRALDFMDLVDRNKDQIKAIIWNEGHITLLTDDKGTEMMFIPEFHPAATLFFEVESKRDTNMFSDDFGKKIWEGEFVPVQFTKRNLLKFLTKYASYFDEEVEKAVKNLKVTQKRKSESEMISLDSPGERTVEEFTEDTNLPSSFTANIPIFDGYEAELHFEAKVARKKDKYGDATKGNAIEIRCTNAKEALRDVMNHVVGDMPEGIPKYYGAMHVQHKRQGY